MKMLLLAGGMGLGLWSGASSSQEEVNAAVLSWSADPQASYYQVQESFDQGQNWVVIADNLTSPSYEIPEGGEPRLIRPANCNQVACVAVSGFSIFVNPNDADSPLPPSTPNSLGLSKK